MLENKKLNMILSLLIAIALWAFVIGEVNPEATRTYRDVPIQLINEETLDDRGLAVLSVSDTVLSVTVTGTRSEVNQIDLKDITAVIDLEDAELGENSLKVDVKVPSRVDIETQSISKVKVIVEEQIAKDVEVHVKYNGTFEAEKEPVTIDQSAYWVTVTGAASNVERVAHVNAVAPEGSVGEEGSTFSCSLVPVNSSELRVYNVDLSFGSIDVTAELARTKTVPLVIPVKETKKDSLVRTITAPEQITLKGRGVDLDPIEQITAEEIDINDVTENTTIEIVPILPENVQLSSESKSLLMNVQVKHMKSGEITLSDEDIQVSGLEEGLEAVVNTKKYTVTVFGETDVVNSLSPENIALSVDLTGLNTGKHTVKLKAECSVPGIELKYTPESVKVTLKESADEPTEDDERGEDTEDNTEKKDENSEE